MAVEKIDLKSLFAPVCAEYRVPLANMRGSSDINSRAAMMRRFAKHEAEGRQCVLLYAGDHDPAGLRISDFLHKNLADLSNAVGWNPERLIIDRFGLNADFIHRHGLTWIDNLETGSGGKLDDPRHPDHRKAYVQDYGPRHPDGSRIVKTVVLLLPRGNRKTSLAAALALLHTIGPERIAQGEAIFAAADRKQVGIAFKEALGIIRADKRVAAATRVSLPN
ncbi:terminase large subunit / phage terminase [Brucella sp. NF 2653]|nr:terminase large subunit / phage terminase [Brucella sp. NF 2653]